MKNRLFAPMNITRFQRRKCISIRYSKTKVIFKDQYLIDCIAYVEQNPVRANLTNSPKDYEFNSYKERNLTDVKNGTLLDKLIL